MANTTREVTRKWLIMGSVLPVLSPLALMVSHASLAETPDSQLSSTREEERSLIDPDLSTLEEEMELESDDPSGRSRRATPQGLKRREVKNSAELSETLYQEGYAGLASKIKIIEDKLKSEDSEIRLIHRRDKQEGITLLYYKGREDNFAINFYLDQSDRKLYMKILIRKWDPSSRSALSNVFNGLVEHRIMTPEAKSEMENEIINKTRLGNFLRAPGRNGGSAITLPGSPGLPGIPRPRSPIQFS